MSENLRIVFMGTPDFAVPALEALVKEGYDVAAVVTAPDKPAGRGLGLQESEVKKSALKNRLKILQPVALKSQVFLDEIKEINPDVMVVVAFRMLPEAVWAFPPKGTLNLHASLLPQYRGAAPINRAIINGEKETGLTTFFLQHEIDTGDIIIQEKIKIGDEETAGELYERMKTMGADLVLKTIEMIAEGKVSTQPQSSVSSGLKSAPKIFKEDGKLDFSKKTDEVFNLIRGLSPYPAAWTTLDGKTLKIYSCKKEKTPHEFGAGKILSDGKIEFKISVSDGFILPTELQLEGKKKMKTEDFLRGYRFSEDACCGTN